MTEAMFLIHCNSYATEIHLFIIYWNCHTPFDLESSQVACSKNGTDAFYDFFCNKPKANSLALQQRMTKIDKVQKDFKHVKG